ncbi:MAG: carboxypeptidase-like regulatory domain-containing protein [Candidatus Aminicenantes bacterium]|nr:carboxypeptidase-like regulatory domain-containing protein [Candidatus Aminicenantes bacterium]
MRRFLVYSGLLACLFSFAVPLIAQAPARGNLVGSFFEKDGTTPVVGAVIKLRNISSGAVYEAPASDKSGFFRLDGLAKGIYNFGITTTAGDFNTNELVGIIENETTKISISLNIYEGEIRQAMQEIAREQSVKDNEARVGRVVQFIPGTKEAVVFVEKGALQVDDRIRVRGITTNFYQDVDALGLDGYKIKRALAGQSPFMKIIRDVQIGDAVYLCCKKGVPPFFLTPCGIATVVGGMAGLITVVDKKEVSPFKK